MINKVRIILLVTELLFGFIFIIYGQGEDLFDDKFLHEIHFNKIDTSLLDGTKIYQMVDMFIDGHYVDSIGIKEKVNISGNVPNLKLS